jgi:hypothetical protein
MGHSIFQELKVKVGAPTLSFSVHVSIRVSYGTDGIINTSSWKMFWLFTPLLPQEPNVPLTGI